MTTLFNDKWQFAELPLDYDSMFKDGNPVLFNPQQFLDKAGSLSYKSVDLPHDWMISHVKDLYKNSVGFYKKSFTLTGEEVSHRRNAIRFEGVYMNCGIWVNGSLAGEWKYGYSTFEFDISNFVKEGQNEIIVIVVYQNCNTRWYSGAGIFRDVTYINTPLTHLPTDGLYICAKPASKDLAELINNGDELSECLWNTKIYVEVAGPVNGHKVRTTIKDKDGKDFISSAEPVHPLPLAEDEAERLHRNLPSLEKYQLSKAYEELTVTNPELWDLENPYVYTVCVELLDDKENVIDSLSQNFGFKLALFDANKGFFLNGNHVKLFGACQHHDLGALGSAFDKNALRRQFLKLKDMGVNAIRCSHNPPPKAWMDLCDELGLLVDDEAFDMWEKPKTQFDYGNYFNDWCEKDVASWVRKDRNHPSLIMWSIGNEIYDTHMGNGFEITKKLYQYVVQNDFWRVAPVTIASNYMMTEGAEHCATEIDTVGYNYLERLYNEHHKKYPEWKIYGSETGSTVQSRGIYHFPDSLKLVTFSDGQCSTLGNCTTPWGCANTQTVIANDRDCPFSAGQFIWTGWDYIGEPTPYHSKSSFFGQIDTAGFPKDTFYLYKSEWAGKKAEPFVHLLPYWDWNEGQMIDVKAYSNADEVELFYNDKSLGKHKIDHTKDAEPFGHWQLEYHKGEIKALAYDSQGKVIASDSKRSFEDPAVIVMEPEKEDYDNLFFIELKLADKNGTLVENARNYITFNVTGDAELLGMDNGDSTDYEEYTAEGGKTHTRRLFSNRLIAIVRAKKSKKGIGSFVITAASKDLPNVSLKYDGKEGKWVEAAPYNAIHAVEDFVPVRKIELIAEGSTKLNKDCKEVKIKAKVLPENATIKEINWNPVLKECVASNSITVEIEGQEGKVSKTALVNARVSALGDGECILRCTATNGSNLDQVISDLPFTVSGMGNPNVNPYQLVEACRFNDYDSGSGTEKEKPELSLESGISTRKSGPTWITFEKVEFGAEGADSIHIPVFSHATELPVEVWRGRPGKGTDWNGSKDAEGGLEQGECLGKFTYKHESIYNVYSENVFTLSRRLFGVETISIVLPDGIYFHGFYFDKTPKAFAKLRALDADVIAGDSFTKTAENVEGIGNNVNLDFSNMNFGSSQAKKLVICGKSNTENNTINVKFFGADGSSSTSVIEFTHTDDYEEKTFEIPPVTGDQKISFVFLPGCNFDFKWFRFE